MKSYKTSSIGWIARILCIAAILFVSMFALDAFNEGETIFQKLAAFGMHLLPSIVLALILFIAWKHERTGGIILILIGLLLSPFIFNMNVDRTGSWLIGLEVILMINLPFIIAGILFILSSIKSSNLQTR